MMAGTEKTMSDVRPSCLRLLRRGQPVVTATFDGSRSVSIHGPSGQNVSKPLARAH